MKHALSHLTKKEALLSAQRLCSHEEKCKSDILSKLKEWGLEPAEFDFVISALEKEHFIDETRYAAAFTKDKYRFNKWGRIKIRYELQRKSLPASVIESALEEIDEQEYHDLLQKELEKKYKSVTDKNPMKIKARLVRFAASKGFEADLTWAIVNKLTGHED